MPTPKGIVGRRCGVPRCPTILSIYNRSTWCFPHQDAARREKVEWDIKRWDEYQARIKRREEMQAQGITPKREIPRIRPASPKRPPPPPGRVILERIQALWDVRMDPRPIRTE